MNILCKIGLHSWRDLFTSGNIHTERMCFRCLIHQRLLPHNKWLTLGKVKAQQGQHND